MKDKNINRKIGAAGVMRVKAELLARGFDVAEPDVDCGVDLIAWDHKRIFRIQVKSTIQKPYKNGATFHTTKIVKKSNKSRSSYDPREVDFLICTCIPTNQFWIIPAKDAIGIFKTSVRVGDEYNNKWILLSRSGRLIDGEKFMSTAKLNTQIWEHERTINNLREILKEYKYEKEILEHKIYNYYQHLKRDMAHRSVLNIEKYGTIYGEDEWFVNHFKDDAQKIKYGYEKLCDLYEKLNQCRSGAQGDPATGCPPSVCSPLVSPA
jgi:hypothetical protein